MHVRIYTAPNFDKFNISRITEDFDHIYFYHCRIFFNHLPTMFRYLSTFLPVYFLVFFIWFVVFCCCYYVYINNSRQQTIYNDYLPKMANMTIWGAARKTPTTRKRISTKKSSKKKTQTPKHAWIARKSQKDLKISDPLLFLDRDILVFSYSSNTFSNKSWFDSIYRVSASDRSDWQMP